MASYQDPIQRILAVYHSMIVTPSRGPGTGRMHPTDLPETQRDQSRQDPWYTTESMGAVVVWTVLGQAFWLGSETREEIERSRDV